jgi:signal transduction histidine kinase
VRNLFSSLRTRLVVSHVAVVVAGVITMFVAVNRLAPMLVGTHFRQMESLVGSMMGHDQLDDLEQGILAGFNQALLIAAAASTIVALLAAAVASGRLLRPIGVIQRATRRLAAGNYRERVPLPRESELAALANDVNALASALQETEARRMRLISEVAHELRTPLATIKGYMEGLVDGVFPADTEIFTATAREAGRLERLANDLSELSRSEEDRLELEFRHLNLAKVAIEAAERLRPQFDDSGVALEIHSMPVLEVDADQDRMAQVFTNVIGNALTYTQSGGSVTLSGEVIGGDVLLTVTDTGRGLAPEQLGSVFERFYRADRSVPGGTGIGLTIARNIVRQHGGEISAMSPGLGEGSTFTLKIPQPKGRPKSL